MIFTSLSFLVFLIILFIVYYVTRCFIKDKQWVVLLIFSIVFYTYLNPKYIFFLAVSVFVTWSTSIGLKKRDNVFSERLATLSKEQSDYKIQRANIRNAVDKQKKCLMALCLVINLGILCFVKYANIFANYRGHNIDWLIVPLGISFYTFQSLGYCIDVYRGIVEPENNILKYFLYVSFFPQISQGPIGHYEDLMPQLMRDHDFDYDSFIKGLERIIRGYFKKILIANNLGLVVDTVYGNHNAYSGIVLTFATVMYAIQLYADFSGYMDIALGVGCCLGIELDENFKTPYFSKGISEYWRRWHITLGAWFRDYLYYPVLRSKPVSKLNKKLMKSGHKKLAQSLTTSIGLLATWLCIGFWHGASLNFIAHGLFHGFFVIMAAVLSDVYKGIKNWLYIHEKSRLFALFQIARTFTIVNIGYVMFRADSMRTALDIYKSILTNFSGGFIPFLLNYNRSFWIIVVFATFVCFVIDLIEEHISWVELLHKIPNCVRWFILYVMLFLVLIYAFDQPASAGSFLYFDF